MTEEIDAKVIWVTAEGWTDDNSHMDSKGRHVEGVKYRLDLATRTQSGSVVAGQDGYVWKHPHQSAEYILRDAIYFAERHTGGDFPLMYLLPLAKAAKLSQSGSVSGLLNALMIAKRDFTNWLPNKDARDAAIDSIDKAIAKYRGTGEGKP